jgi:hypothetical protein
LFRYCQSIVHLDPKISNRAFNLGVAKQKLNGPEMPVRRQVTPIAAIFDQHP